MQATPSATLKATNAAHGSSVSTKSHAGSTAKSKVGHSGAAAAAADANIEIEEISKKISEHADAIYRTWKCRGLAPTELLELYTNAAAAAESTGSGDFFAAKVVGGDNASTEGLQKLVSSFVIKDKEQRGVKTSNPGGSGGGNSARNKNAILKLTNAEAKATLPGNMAVNKVTHKTVQAVKQATVVQKPATQKSTTLRRADDVAADVVDAKPAARKVSKSGTAARTALKSEKPLYLREHENKAEHEEDERATVASANVTTPTKTRSAAAGTKAPQPVDINLNFDLELNLNLDVNNLTQLQTLNLLKIKELLQENEQGVPQQTLKATVITPATTRTTITAATNKKSDNNSSRLANRRTAAKSNNSNSHGSASAGGGGGGSVDSHAGAINADKNSSVTTTTNSAAFVHDTSANKAHTKSLYDNQQAQPTSSSSGCNHKTAAKEDDEKAPKSSNRTIKSATKENGSRNNAHPSTARLTPKDKPTAERKEQKSDASSPAFEKDNVVMEVARSSMPAPTKAKSGRAALLANGQDHKNLGRPILTRGSVAERVLMFEKCPDVRHSFLNIKRPDPAEAPPKSLLKVKLHATPPTPSEHNSLQREIRSSKSVYIPRFYFPHGKPQPTIALERTLRGILSAFDSFPNNQVTKDELPRILKLCGLPFYWRMPVMIFCQQGNSGLVERQRFVEFWKQMNVYCHDAASRLVYILSRGQRFRSYILPEDMVPLVQDVVDTHPGLAFLKEATEFHSRYVHTVIARIFYSVNRSWSGKISISELKKSDLIEILTLLEEEDDINQIMAFFSYEHFYVIYCKFWELDKDHDLLINQDDLAGHSDHALSTRIIERIFSGCVTRNDNRKCADDEPKMSYTDFVWFLLSEEDKRTPTAIEYWFRCMDVDGDGVLSMYELEYFYEEQQQRMESIGIETLPFEDCLCQMLDMIKPQRRDCVTLSDLKRCKMTHVFFDTFFNLEKYLDHEQRDPFASQRDEYTSDWDRFAAQEYELLITEESE